MLIQERGQLRGHANTAVSMIKESKRFQEGQDPIVPVVADGAVVAAADGAVEVHPAAALAVLEAVLLAEAVPAEAGEKKPITRTGSGPIRR